MSPDEFRAHGHELVEWIARYLETVRDRPVLPEVTPGEVIDALPVQGPEKGEPFSQILEDFNEAILPGSTLWNHPRFFSYFAVSATPPSMLAEFLSAALNQNGILWKSGPALTELEQVVLGWIREWVGLPEEFFGIIYDTASISTLHALIAARQSVDQKTRKDGAARNLVVYTSNQAHSSVEKGALALGFGEENIRKIECDAEFRLSIPALKAALEEDVKEGKIPCCIVPTIGATPTASIDPVAAVIPLARQYGCWVHVDAAYAGPAALLEEKQWMFQDWELADSIVLNPHKWMLVNVDASILFIRRKDQLSDAIGLTPEYLRTQSDPRMLNYMDYSISLGRRFRALKLWMTLRYYGREGVAGTIRSHIGMADWLREQIEADPRFEVAAPVHLGLVCFRMKDSNEKNQQLMDTLNTSGFAFLSHTIQNGQYVLRFSVGNWMTTKEDVEETWERIRKVASAL